MGHLNNCHLGSKKIRASVIDEEVVVAHIPWCFVRLRVKAKTSIFEAYFKLK